MGRGPAYRHSTIREARDFYLSGKTPKEISIIFDIPAQTVHFWRTRYKWENLKKRSKGKRNPLKQGLKQGDYS